MGFGYQFRARQMLKRDALYPRRPARGCGEGAEVAASVDVEPCKVGGQFELINFNKNIFEQQRLRTTSNYHYELRTNYGLRTNCELRTEPRLFLAASIGLGPQRYRPGKRLVARYYAK